MVGQRRRDDLCEIRELELELEQSEGYRDVDRGAVAAHSASCEHAARKTHSPIFTMSPVRSATGTKSTGDTDPSSGLVQRAKASKPTAAPLTAYSSRPWPPVRTPTTPSPADPPHSQAPNPIRGSEADSPLEQFAAALLKTETDSRDSHGGQVRIKAARFPARKTLEEFDFAF